MLRSGSAASNLAEARRRRARTAPSSKSIGACVAGAAPAAGGEKKAAAAGGDKKPAAGGGDKKPAGGGKK